MNPARPSALNQNIKIAQEQTEVTEIFIAVFSVISCEIVSFFIHR
jgi:hypothetical protein